MAGRGGKNPKNPLIANNGGLPGPHAVDGWEFGEKQEDWKPAGEGVLKWTFAAKKQSCGLDPCATSEWLWGTVVPQVPGRWSTGWVRAPEDFHPCFNSVNICFVLFFLIVKKITATQILWQKALRCDAGCPGRQRKH